MPSSRVPIELHWVFCTPHPSCPSMPEDVSVIGYDDEPDVKYWMPPLSTIRQPQYEMGTKAAELLCERIQNRDLPQRQIIIQPQLIVRGSTAQNHVLSLAHTAKKEKRDG
ncbi:MAG: substrate-binding domain-containing protein [Chloroflexi bacterium]|nr:substrate-binding domain-containing protein [Chloroflexota bacterium]